MLRENKIMRTRILMLFVAAGLLGGCEK